VLPLFSSWTLLQTLPYWRLDSNQRFQLTATGMDDISVHWYVSILVAGEGLEPPSSAYETELETTSSLTRYISYITTSATSWKPPLTRCLKESVCGLILLSYGNIVVRGWNRTTGTRRFKSLLYLLSYRTIFEVENLCVVVCDYNFCNSSNVTLLYNSFLKGTTQYCW
jgi:hypothetical protein